MIRHPIGTLIRPPIASLIADQLGLPDPWLYVMDASIASAFSLSGSAIVSHTNRGHTLTSPGTRFVRNTSTTIAGSPVMALTYTGIPRLFTTSGGLTGDAPHAIFAVVRKRATQISPQLGVIGILGQINGGGHSLGNSLVGTVGETLTSGGAFGAFTPEGPYPSGVTVIAKRYSAGNTFLYPDGVPVQDPSALTASPTAYTLNLSSGLGFEFMDNSNGPAEMDLAWFGVTRHATTMYEQQVIIAALCARFGIAQLPIHVECFGDSITYGSILLTQTPLPYPAVCQADMRAAGITGVVCNNHGNPGFTSDQLLVANVAPLQLDNNFSLRYPTQFSVHMYGTNDIKPPNFGLATHVIDNMILDFAARRRAGFTVCAMTIVPPDASGSPDPSALVQQNLVNAWLRTTALDDGHITALADWEDPANVAAYGDLSLTAFHSDVTHPNAAGYAVGGHIVADMLIPLCS